VLLPPWRNKV